MNGKQKDVNMVFLEAVEKPTAKERAAYLDEVCRNDVALRAELESLLRAHEKAGDFLESPILDSGVTLDESPISEGPGTVIGRYKLLEKIGEGGMAVVYMAEQTEPIRRKVALKIIKLGMDTKNVIARFEAERQALALMDHPNVAKIFDGGTTDTGRPYFVMELVRGVSITEYCDTNRLSPRERLELFVQVCQAVQHAHTKGIIHRDLKPSNVMVTLHDSQPVPKIIDFGIAKATNQRLTEKTLFTRYAQIIGTPEYMSPEQAQMSGLDVDTRTDIYSLGVLLYELLTGTTPFGEEELRRAGYLEMQRVIREQEPVKPSTKLSTLGETLTGIAKCRNSTPELLRRAIRGDLDWIVMKSLEKDRVRRYETASGLAQDLERHLNNEPVLARPPSTLYRFQKLVRRNRGVFATVTAVAAALVIGLTVSAVSLVREQHARRVAVAAQEKETAQRRKAEALAYASDMSLAQQALAGDDLGRARRLLDAHRPAAGEVDRRDWEWRYLWQECRSDTLGELCRYPNAAHSVAYSPNGKMLAVAGYVPGFVDIRDISSRQRIILLQPKEGCVVAFSPRGDLLATDAGSQICLWQTATWTRVRQIPLDGSVRALKFSPDGTRLASLSVPDEITMWEVDPWAEVRRIRSAGPAELIIATLDFSPDSKKLITGSLDGHLQAIDLAGGTTGFDIAATHLPEGVTPVAWSSSSSLIASGSGFSRGPIRLWDGTSGRLLGVLQGHTSWISELVFSTDGRRLYSASADQTIRIWDVGARHCLATLRGSTDEIWGLALSPDGATLASVSKDGVVCFWSALPRPEEEMPRRIELGGPAWPAFSPNSRVLAMPRAGTVRLLDLATFKEVEQLPQLGSDVLGVLYSSDGTLLTSGGSSGKLRVWSCAERRLVWESGDPNAPLYSFRYYSDGRRLLSLDGKGNATWRDILTGQAVRTFTVETRSLPAAALAPDGRLLVVGTDTGAMHWLDAETGELLATATDAHHREVFAVAFSADGLWAASVDGDGMVAIWDRPLLRLIGSFRGHMHASYAVAFSPDGRRLATGCAGEQEAVKLWDLSTETPHQLIAPVGDGWIFGFVGFSPDGQWLAACSLEGKLYLWRAPSWEEIEAAEKKTQGSPSP
jgi:WD40 repeat protein/serine/threonine protein kinase